MLSRSFGASPASPNPGRPEPPQDQGPTPPPALPQVSQGVGGDPPCATFQRGQEAPLLSYQWRAGAWSRGHVSQKETLARWQGVSGYGGRGWVVLGERPQSPTGFHTLTPLASLICPQK